MDRELLKKISKHLEEDVRIGFAYLYGSAARGEMTDNSDLDIAIFLADPADEEDPLLEERISLELEKTAEREVDIRVINSAPAVFVYQVLKKGKLLFSKDDKRRVEFEVKNIDEYLDFLPLMKEYDEKRLERYGIR